MLHPQLPGFYPHSEWATLGPVHVGVRFHFPGPSVMTNLGCKGAAIYTAISSGPADNSQSPEQGGGCYL